MGTLASLSVSLTARINKFEKGFKRASKIARRFGRDMSRHAKTVAKFGLVAGAVAVGAVAALIKNQFKMIDSTAKLSDVLGFTTEQLASYQFGAKIAGIEQGKFNSSMIRFSKSIADAQDGLSTPIRALDRLGLKFADLQNLTKHDQLLLIADRFAQLGNQVDKDAVLLNLFGRSGAAMGKFLEKGSAGIEGMIAEAEKMGIAFNRIDAAQVEQANDAMTRMSAIMTGAAQIAAIQLAPVITAVLERMTMLAEEGGGMGRVVFNAFKQITMATANTADFFERLKSGWYGFEAAISGTTTILLNFAKFAVQALRPFAAFFPQLENGFKLLDDLTNNFQLNTEESVNKSIEAYNKFKSGVNSKQASGFIFQAQQRAASIAMKSFKNIKVPDIGLGNIGSSDRRVEFGQTDFSRAVNFNSGNPNKKNGTTETQGNMIIELLERIERKTDGGSKGIITA